MAGKLLDYLIQLVTQFAGGPGGIENNLMRFGLPALFWGMLLVVAASRQRQGHLPRESLLVWGFGIGLVRELFMFGFVSLQMLDIISRASAYHISAPLERALAMAAVVMVAGSFLQYILEDARLARRYLVIGLGATIVCYLATFWWWAGYFTANPAARFGQTWCAWLFRLTASLVKAVPIFLVARQRGWLRNIVLVALTFFLMDELLMLINLATDEIFTTAICPIAHSFHILAIPLLGYVYIRELSIERNQAEAKLKAHRDHLEELVKERTAELTTVNAQLEQEIVERKRAEVEIVQRSTRLAAQNAVAATLSQSLELESVLNAALDVVLAVLEMEVGIILLLDPKQTLVLQICRGQGSPEDLKECLLEECPSEELSNQAVTSMQAVVLNASDAPAGHVSCYAAQKGFKTLVSTPLVSKGRAVGALTLGTRQENAVQQSELELVTAIGQQVGMAIENARLYQEAERWAGELALLHQVSIFLTSTLDADRIYDQVAEQSAKLLGCQMACVLLQDTDQQSIKLVSSYGMNESEIRVLHTQPDNPKLWSELAVSRRSIAIENAESDARVPSTWRAELNVRALLCLPIWGPEEPMGFLFLLDQQAPRRWRPEELELIESFINRAAIALVNANLHKQLEWAAALEERQRIAADMHDGLAQTLGLLGLRVDRAVGLIDSGSDPEAVQELQRIREAVGQASGQVRQSIASLQGPPPPRLSLQTLLSDLADRCSEGDGPPVDLHLRVQDPLFVLPDHVAQVVPVAQEAVLNAQRHAQAQRIAVTLDRQGKQVRITVEDDGRGFDPHAAPEDKKGHFGLSIMRARAARIGARLQINSVPGQGTKVSLTWTPSTGQGRAQLDARRQITLPQSTFLRGAKQ